MTHHTSIPASSVLAIALSNCTLWGVNQQETGDEGAGDVSEPLGTTHASISSDVLTTTTPVTTLGTTSTSGQPDPMTSSTNETNLSSDTGDGVGDSSTTSTSMTATSMEATTTSESDVGDPMGDPPCDFVVVDLLTNTEVCAGADEIRFVFVTSKNATRFGDFAMFFEDVISLDEELCNVPVVDASNDQDKDVPPLPGSYKAWISFSGASPSMWPVGFVGKYVMHMPGQAGRVILVAESWEALLSASDQNPLRSPINITEYGEPAMTDGEYVYAWTGVDVGGGVAVHNCSNWKAPFVPVCDEGTDVGMIGRIDATGGAWTNASGGGCMEEATLCSLADGGKEHRIYCVQQ